MNWANLSALALDIAWGVGKPMLYWYLNIAGFFIVLWAIHLVLVQPPPRRDEIGWTAQMVALLMAVPLVAIGAALIYFAAKLAMG